MIKCLICGDEFSYGRKISCCNTTYFGMIFNKNRKNRKWNCLTKLSINRSYESFIDSFPEKKIIKNEPPSKYNWNCETSMRFKNHQELLERKYVLIYE